MKFDRKYKLILSILVTVSFFLPITSFQLGPQDPACYEIAGACDLFEAPLDAMAAPFEEVFGDLTFVVFWGIIMGILWIRVQNTMMVGVTGVLLAAVFTLGFDQDAKIIGYGLLALAGGIALYQIISVKLHYPIN